MATNVFRVVFGGVANDRVTKKAREAPPFRRGRIIDETLWSMLDNTDAISLLKEIEKKEKPAKPRALKRTPRGMEEGRASVFTVIVSNRKGKSSA